MKITPDKRIISIFLLADDGQMERLLRRSTEQSQAEIVVISDILSGIACTAGEQPDIILINLSVSGTNSASIVQALTHASPRSRIVGYGEAWTETYFAGLERQGMKDLLIMPAPLHEIQRIIFDGQFHYEPVYVRNKISSSGTEIAPEDVSALVGVFSNMVRGSFLKICQELSVAISQGPDILCRKAERAFEDFLQVKKVSIYNDLRDSASDTNEFGIIDYYDERLSSVTGEFMGIMRIWPGENKPDAKVVNSLAGYLAALLALAWRDQNLRSLATVDELTGIYNRRYLESFLRQLLEKAQVQDIKISVLVFDIDNFKYYNDTYGHISGDYILCQAAQLAKQCCRKYDVVARLGGDEFAVLFWDSPEISRPAKGAETGSEQMPSNSEMALRMSNQFRDMMCNSPCASRFASNACKLTISGGVATYPADGDTVRQLLLAADTALLKAKSDGKNKINAVK